MSDRPAPSNADLQIACDALGLVRAWLRDDRTGVTTALTAAGITTLDGLSLTIGLIGSTAGLLVNVAPLVGLTPDQLIQHLLTDTTPTGQQ